MENNATFPRTGSSKSKLENNVWHSWLGVQLSVRESIESLRDQSAATLFEAQGQRGRLPSYLKALYHNIKLCGRAFTVRCRPGDNLMLHHALSLAGDGDVLVVDASGYLEAGIWGDVMTAAAQARGIRGLVIDGAIRDSLQLRNIPFPVFTHGISVGGSTKRLLGEISVPLIFGETTVTPGDWLLGDDDGVVCIPSLQLREVLAMAKERDAREAGYRQRLREGESTVEIFNLGPMLDSLGVKVS